MKEFINKISKYATPIRVGKRVGLRVMAVALLGAIFVVAQSSAPSAAVATAAACHSTWRPGHGTHGFNHKFTEVKWVTNSCGNLIRERTICSTGFLGLGGKYATDPSGIVIKTGVWARTFCKTTDWDLWSSQMQWRRPGPGRHWSAWQTIRKES